MFEFNLAEAFVSVILNAVKSEKENVKIGSKRIEKNETMTDPIFSITPYHNDDKRYYIDSVLNQDNSITIKIKPLSCKADFKKILKQNALNFLKANKIDLDKYKIEYVEDC